MEFSAWREPALRVSRKDAKNAKKCKGCGPLVARRLWSISGWTMEFSAWREPALRVSRKDAKNAKKCKGCGPLAESMAGGRVQDSKHFFAFFASLRETIFTSSMSRHSG
jgi:hypothetical protein